MNVEVAGSDIILTISNYPLIEKNPKYVKLPSLGGLIERIDEELKDKDYIYADERIFAGHVDTVMTACRVNGQFHVYLYEKVLERLEGDELMDSFFFRDDVDVRSVDTDLVLQGGLNIKYLDGIALVTEKEDLDRRLAGDLRSIGIKIVEIGREQFSLSEKAGVKCRSLNLQWRMNL